MLKLSSTGNELKRIRGVWTTFMGSLHLIWSLLLRIKYSSKSDTEQILKTALIRNSKDLLYNSLKLFHSWRDSRWEDQLLNLVINYYSELQLHLSQPDKNVNWHKFNTSWAEAYRWDQTYSEEWDKSLQCAIRTIRL